VSQDDPTWWQAKRVGDSNLRAGLIPSRQFQERYTTKIMSTVTFYLPLLLPYRPDISNKQWWYLREG